MVFKKALLQVIIVCYLTVTLSAFLYTMLRVRIPGVPASLHFFSYGMMAPYQGYRTHNEELRAEGMRDDGVWEDIDMDRYLPFIRGEKAMRSYLFSFRVRGDAVLADAYKMFARKVQALEQAQGREYGSIRLSLQKWPMSPGGYFFLKREPFIDTTFLVLIP